MHFERKFKKKKTKHKNNQLKILFKIPFYFEKQKIVEENRNLK